MIPNNVVSILPFYKTLGEQNHRKDYAFNEVFDLITPTQTILPFQIIRDTRPEVASQITLVVKNIKDVAVMTIPFGLDVTGLSINRYPSKGFDIIKYASTGVIEIIEPLIGQHYIELNDGVETFYSEVFTYVDSVSEFLKIEFWDNENMEINSGLIDFMDGFKYRLYLNTQVGRPDYEFEEEVTKRDGYQFVEKQISEKTYKFNFLAPEYLCDAMRIIRMMDNITITSKGNVYNADQFLITPKWQSRGYYAAVETEFQSDTIIKKTGARFIPIDNTDPNANNAKVYIGSLIDQDPSELAVRALTEYEAVKQNYSFTEVLGLGKRFCIAYPASFGDLTEAFVLESFDILSVFKKIEMDFTFGTATVPMFVYVYESPITYLTTPNLPKTIHYNFTPVKDKFGIGDTYAGGIVAYLFQPGDTRYVEGENHGLIAAPYDASVAQWSKSYLGSVGAEASGIGDGKQNTLNIQISLGASIPPHYAAMGARLVGIGDYHDWFLPSQDELDKLYEVKDIIGGFENTTIYWSSTEHEEWHPPLAPGPSNDTAYYKVFAGANVGESGWIIKTTSGGGVRAVRYF